MNITNILSFFKAGMTSFEHLYSNIFSYQLYIGICLLMMIIYSFLYLLLAMYIERVNPGEFGISQPWYFPFTKAYWKPQSAAMVSPVMEAAKPDVVNTNPWIDTRPVVRSGSTDQPQPALTISHLTKVCNR